LARRWVGSEEDPYKQARTIERHLRKDYTYDLDSPSGANPDPLDHFLFDSKRGHCEFYSTAMAVMLRELGVPSRNATGFIGGTYNGFGEFYAVRQGDAHSWVEAFLPGRGWTRFDPTPPASAAPQSEINGVFAFVRDLLEASAQRWNHHVVGYNLRQQVDLLRSVRDKYRRLKVSSKLGLSSRRTWPLAVGVLLLLVGVYYLVKQRRKTTATEEAPEVVAARNHEVIDLYRSLEAVLAHHGAARPASTPPLAHARSLSEIGHPLGAEALALTELYIEVRFGGRRLPEGEKKDFARRVKLLRQHRESERAAA
jgi:hypothetical protein